MLRQYQQGIYDQTLQSLEIVDRVLVQSPTGTGKGRLITHLLKYFNKGLIVAHRQEILEQLYAHYKEEGLDDKVGILNSKVTAGEDTRLFFIAHKYVIASIQTVARRLEQIPSTMLDIVIIDEAHRASAASYQKLINLAGIFKVVGFTATPIRGDGKPLGDTFEMMVQALDVKATYKFFIDNNHLTKVGKIFSKPEPNLSGIDIVAGDYNQKKLSKLMNNNVHVGSLVNQWLKRSENRPTLTFCTSIENVIKAVDMFRESGIEAQAILGDTPDALRKMRVKQLETGRLKVLISCLVFIEGVDIPMVSCIQMDRPTRLFHLYLQIVGRGFRPCDGKTDFIILDHCGVVRRFGPPNKDIMWSLDKDLIVPPSYVRACPACDLLNELDATECAECGESLIRGGVNDALGKAGKAVDNFVNMDLTEYQHQQMNPFNRPWRTDISGDDYIDYQFMLINNKNEFRKCNSLFKSKYGYWPPIRWILHDPRVVNRHDWLYDCLCQCIMLKPIDTDDSHGLGMRLQWASNIYKEEFGIWPASHSISVVRQQWYDINGLQGQLTANF